MSNESKHFNSGCVFGRVIEEPEVCTSSGGKEYISFKVSVAGRKSGSVSAFCRMWDADRVADFLDAWRDKPSLPFFLKGFFSQYRSEKNEFMSNFTVYHWEHRESVDPRAVFVLRGIVGHAMTFQGGQRILFNVHRDGQQPEEYELFSPADMLLDTVGAGDFLEVKGYLRQEATEDEFGGSSGPIRAYIHELKPL